MVNTLVFALAWALHGDVHMLHVGDSEVSATFLKPYHNYWKVDRITPEGKKLDMGVWSDDMMEVDYEGQKAWKRVQVSMDGEGKVRTLTNIFDKQSVAPLYSEMSWATGGYMKRTFHGASMDTEIKTTLEEQNGWTKFPAPLAPQGMHQATMATPAFDFAGGMFGMLLVCFPLADHYKASFPFVGPKGATPTATSEVVGHELVHTPTGDIDCFKVVTTQPAGTLTCWLSKEAPYLIKIDAAAPVWGSTVYEMR